MVTDVPSGPVQLPPLAQRSIVYAADGSTLAVLHDASNREPVTLGPHPGRPTSVGGIAPWKSRSVFSTHPVS